MSDLSTVLHLVAALVVAAIIVHRERKWGKP